MPYIEQMQRRDLDGGLSRPRTPGQLNYEITKLIKKYIEVQGESYQIYNDILGVLSAAGFELYRRKIAKYEDGKIKANGDVY